MPLKNPGSDDINSIASPVTDARTLEHLECSGPITLMIASLGSANRSCLAATLKQVAGDDHDFAQGFARPMQAFQKFILLSV